MPPRSTLSGSKLMYCNSVNGKCSVCLDEKVHIQNNVSLKFEVCSGNGFRDMRDTYFSGPTDGRTDGRTDGQRQIYMPPP